MLTKYDNIYRLSMLDQTRLRDSKSKLNVEMLFQCLVLGCILRLTSAWDKDNSKCQLNYEVNVTKEALCCQSLQPNKARHQFSREGNH